MVVHTLLLIVVSSFGMVVYRMGSQITAKRNRIFVWGSLFLVFLIQSLRAPSVGWDTYNYVYSFDQLRSGKYNYMSIDWEPLYVGLNKFVGFFTSSSQVFLAACSFIILFGYGYFVISNLNEGESAFWPIFFFITLYQYFNSSNLIREYLALAFVINIYTVLRKGKTKQNFVKAIVLLVIGFFFHQSAAIAVILFVPFIFNFKSPKDLLLAGILVMIGIVGYEYLLQLFLRLFPYFNKYEKGGVRLNGSESLGLTFAILSILKVGAVLIVFLLRYKSEKEKKEVYALSFIIIVATGFTLMRTRVMLALRAGYYFEVFFPLFIMKVMIRMEQYRKLIYVLGYAFGWLFFLYSMLNERGGSRGNVPYYFFWQE